MTKEEFKTKVAQEFFSWASNRERPESSWWLSLEEFASMSFNRAAKQEDRRQP